MYNKVVLVGNLTRDVVIKYLQSGTAVGEVGIAVNRKFKTQAGEQKDEIMFIDLTFFGRTAEIANQYLRKGSKVLVDGRLMFQQWTAQDGSKRSKHAITVENLTMLDTKAEGIALSQSEQSDYTQPQASQPPAYQAPQQQQQSGYAQPQASQQPAYQAPQQQQAQPSVPVIDIDEDEIPF